MHAQRETLGSYDEPPSLVDPPLRVWELNKTSSRYDRSFAAPSDETLQLMWSLWSGFFFLFSAVILVVFMAMVRSKRVRQQSFNLYLIFLVFPDLLFVFLCASTCLYLAINPGYEYPIICRIQSFYAVFGLGANSWLNAMIGMEVHRMLRESHQGIRYQPPSLWQVRRNSLCCYLFTILFALCGWFRETLPLWPTVAQNGILCLPGEYNQTTTIFFWIFGVPLLIVIPLVYVAYVSLDVLCHKLLPPSGRRRELAIYFFRILSVFVIFWMPCLLVVCAMGGAHGVPWAVWTLGLWGHFQGVTSAIVIAQKADIKKSIRKLLCLRKLEDDATRRTGTRFFAFRTTTTSEAVGPFTGATDSFQLSNETRRILDGASSDGIISAESRVSTSIPYASRTNSAVSVESGQEDRA